MWVLIPLVSLSLAALQRQCCYAIPGGIVQGLSYSCAQMSVDGLTIDSWPNLFLEVGRWGGRVGWRGRVRIVGPMISKALSKNFRGDNNQTRADRATQRTNSYAYSAKRPQCLLGVLPDSWKRACC